MTTIRSHHWLLAIKRKTRALYLRTTRLLASGYKPFAFKVSRDTPPWWSPGWDKLLYKHHAPVYWNRYKSQLWISWIERRISTQEVKSVLFFSRLLPFLLALPVRLKIIFTLAVVVAIVSHALVWCFHSLFARESIEKFVSVWIHARRMSFKSWTTHHGRLKTSLDSVKRNFWSRKSLFFHSETSQVLESFKPWIACLNPRYFEVYKPTLSDSSISRLRNNYITQLCPLPVSG